MTRRRGFKYGSGAVGELGRGAGRVGVVGSVGCTDLRTSFVDSGASRNYYSSLLEDSGGDVGGVKFAVSEDDASSGDEFNVECGIASEDGRVVKLSDWYFIQFLLAKITNKFFILPGFGCYIISDLFHFIQVVFVCFNTVFESRCRLFLFRPAF